MQCKRRYTHLVVITVAYSYLILNARWNFFNEMWKVMGSEPEVDGDHAHALDVDFAVPIRSQRHVKESDMITKESMNSSEKQIPFTKPKIATVLKKDHISRINKRHQLLQNIFTNFLHP